MSELIKDQTYRKFLLTPPRMPAIMRDKGMMSSPPWVVYVQKEVDGKWGKREFWKYSKALKFFNLAVNHHRVHDATINCKRYGFEPPQRVVRVKGQYFTGADGKQQQVTKLIKWEPKLGDGEGQHHWCKYCRRPTVFKHYAKHRRLGDVDTTVPRCCICGASARIALSSSDRRIRK